MFKGRNNDEQTTFLFTFEILVYEQVAAVYIKKVGVVYSTTRSSTAFLVQVMLQKMLIEQN
jgi:hypothetical protein